MNVPVVIVLKGTEVWALFILEANGKILQR
jgi:hypothetical protein